MQIAIERDQGGRLVIENAEALALDFFESDTSSAGEDSFDERARSTVPEAPFAQEDVTPIRAGMRLGRLRQPTWDWLVNESPRAFLYEIDPTWDLVELPDDAWNPARAAMYRALYDFMGAGRGAPVATKFLHYKRRRLFPILDSAVLTMTGLRIPGPTTSEDPDVIKRNRINRAEAAATACERLRGYAIDNWDVLRRIREMLDERGKERTLARILDAVLWSSSPASAPSHTGVIRWSRE